MAKKKEDKEDIFIGTHARLIISDWTVLADLVVKHSRLLKEQHASEPGEEAPEKNAALPHVISRREIEDAINGPLQAFLKYTMSAYMTLSIIRMNLNMINDDTLKDRRANLPDTDKVPESILQNTSLSDLTTIQQALDQATIEHEQAWMQSLTAWKQQILRRLNEQDLSLSDIEVKELLDPEPISELLDRFIALNINLPKMPKSEMNHSKYLTLKADIAIQSALSRQHIPHQQADIEKILVKLKSDFMAISKQESTLFDAQKKVTDDIIANISW